MEVNQVMRLFPALVLLSLLSLSLANKEWEDPERLAEEEGYYKREHSLTQPYQGRGMDVGSRNYYLKSTPLLYQLGTALGVWRVHCCYK